MTKILSLIALVGQASALVSSSPGQGGKSALFSFRNRNSGSYYDGYDYENDGYERESYHDQQRQDYYSSPNSEHERCPYQDERNDHQDQRYHQEQPLQEQRRLPSSSEDNSHIVPYYDYDSWYDNQRPYDRSSDLRRMLDPFSDSFFDELEQSFFGGNPFGNISPFFGGRSMLTPFFRSSGSLLGNMMGMMDQMQSEMVGMMEQVQSEMPTFMNNEPLLEQAEQYINQDIACTTALGDTIQMGQVFGQSTQMVTINGKTQNKKALKAIVRGSMAEGNLQLSATDEGIEQMVLMVNDQGEYREINVMVPGAVSSQHNRYSQPRSTGDGLLDAEVVPDSEYVLPPARQLSSRPSLPWPKRWTRET